MDVDHDNPPGRALLVALSAMVGVALLVGLVVGGVMLGAARVAGLGDSGAQAEEAPDSLYMPRYKPTETVDPDSGQPGESQGPAKVQRTREPREDRITLFVAPQAASPGERINFNGVYVDGEGVALKVQRKDGSTWIDFGAPDTVTATVRGGAFDTWIQTTRTGVQTFRVLDQTANRASNVVKVTIG